MPASWQQVLIIVAALLPGVVFQSIRTYLRGGSPREPGVFTQVSSAIFATLVFAVIYVILSSGAVISLISPTGLEKYPRTAAILITALVVAIPAVAACLFHLMDNWIRLRSMKRALQDFFRADSHATAWDRMISRHFSEGYVRITTKDGSYLGGRLGSSSYASQSPYPRDLYLHNLWEIDEHGCFIKRVEQDQSNCLGVWVDCSSAQSVEIFEKVPRRVECSNHFAPKSSRKENPTMASNGDKLKKILPRSSEEVTEKGSKPSKTTTKVETDPGAEVQENKSSK